MADFSSYKALLFDVDKTLTNSNREITPSTVQAIQYARKKGFTVAVCTGRHFTTLDQTFLFPFEPSELHIVSGGSQIIDTTGKVYWESLIPRETAQTILQTLKKYDAKIYFQTGNTIYGNEKAIHEWKTIVGKQKTLHILPLSEYPNVGVPIIVAHHLSQEAIHSLEAISEVSFKSMNNYDGNDYADITAKGVNKAFALHKWSELMEIQPQQIIGFGDSENDIEFLQAVGYAVAVGNATKEIQSIADEVIPSSDEEGIATFIMNNL